MGIRRILTRRRYCAYVRKLRQLAETVTTQEFIALELLDIQNDGGVITGIVPSGAEGTLLLKYYDTLRRRNVLYAVSLTGDVVDKRIVAAHMTDCTDYDETFYNGDGKRWALEAALRMRDSVFPPVLARLRGELEQKLARYRDLV